MSHTKRYWIDDHSAIEDSDGKWVLHSDYAALVQQGIRDHQDWRSKLNFLEADYKEEIARLTAENERLKAKYEIVSLKEDGSVSYASQDAKIERLIKSGDAVACCLEAYWKGKPYDVETTIKCFDAWNAAKEGRDAK